jgi:proteasome accessory factor BC
VSHDTDKLIRQLSLVAFLMAELRPLTARDIKSNVEGYQEMSDEAFARRFYSDRAELVGLGVPLDSHRDEFTGEELYTLRSERYFLPPLDLDDDELAALQTCLYLLEGRFAYAEPLRLALQNLALGRAGGVGSAPTATAVQVEVRDPDYTPELQGRLGKLEAAISKQRTVRFQYWSIARDDERERTINPYALLPENGTWYVIGLDLGDSVVKSFRVSRIRSEIRFATRRERDFRVPETFDVEEFRGRAEWQFGDLAGEARVAVAPDTAWWVQREYGGPRNRIEDGVFVTAYASLPMLARWILRQEGRAVPLEPSPLRRLVTEGARAARRAHEGPPPDPAAERHVPWHDRSSERQAGPVAPERFGVLQSLLAYLLAACGEERDAVIPASELVERFSIPAELLEEHLSLLNLVNFGGGCYAVYAELNGDEVHVDKELFGDTFRRAPRLTPLEARAIRLALEFVGPMVAAGSRSQLDRVQTKLEEAFGQFDLAQTPTPQAGAEEDLVATLTRAIDRKRLVELEYLKPESTEVETRTIEPYGIERRLPHWYVHTWDVDRDAPRSYRLDRTRTAKLLKERFAPREGFDPSELREATSARIWYSPDVGRWEVEKGALPLVDGAALSERRVGSADWLVGEMLSFRGDAVVLSPPELRKLVATRARELERRLREARSSMPFTVATANRG